MKDKALRLALDALESGVDTQIGRLAWTEYDSCLISDAITAIKEALAQPAPVQETTAAIDTLKFLGYTYHGGEKWKPPLGKRPDWLNEPAQPAPVQEPVAAESKFDEEKKWGFCTIEHHKLVRSEPHRWPGYQTRLLYTTPPQRTWVDLTDEETDDIIANAIDKVDALIQTVDKLKDKNT
jgi:hypothetical protein